MLRESPLDAELVERLCVIFIQYSTRPSKKEVINRSTDVAMRNDSSQAAHSFTFDSMCAYLAQAVASTTADAAQTLMLASVAASHSNTVVQVSRADYEQVLVR